MRWYRPPQKPLAAMSRCAPSWEFEEALVRTSPVRGCRSGSMQTSEQTVRRFAVKSCISLCLMDGNPPFGHDKACTIENLVPHPHIEGDCSGCQLYLRARASWKALLCRVNPNSSIGRQLSHEEAPFSRASCIARLGVWGRSSFRRSAVSVALWYLSLCTSFFASSCLATVSLVY